MTPDPDVHRRRLLRLIVAVVVIVGGSVLVAGRGGDLDLDAARDHLRASGAAGMALYLAAFTLLQPLHVSGHLFSLTAVLVWGQPEGFVLTWVGSILSTISAFAFARYLAHDYVQAKLPDRLRHLDEQMDRTGFRRVLVLRAIFWGTPAVGFAFGASRIRGRTHHLASAIGVLPQVLISSLVASGLSDAIDRGEVSPLTMALAFVGLGALVLLAFLLGRRVLGPEG